ncbi:MAG: DUF2254 domain-containing protein [Burkholderiaceae bacterium]
MYRLILWIRDSENQLWVKPAVGSLVAVLFALLATAGNQFIPDGSLPVIEQETLDSLLGVIASSMLAVTTFSLAIMVSAFASAAQGATPRATALVIGDTDTHTAIASFISAFIYSIIAKTAVGLGYYGPNGRFILFLSTLLVLGYLIWTLVRWVKTLSRLGRMDNTISKINKAASAAMRRHRQSPRMGALASVAPPVGAKPVHATRVAYLQHIDMDALQKLAVEADGRLHILVRPGALTHPGTVLVMMDCAKPPSDERVRESFVFGDGRSFDQDPRFGLIVLSEVALRALSPAVNDPGTAIAAMTAMAQVLIDAKPDTDDEVPQRDRLTLADLVEDDFIHAGFDPIARDGAASREVVIRMQKLLGAIADNCGGALARAARRQALTAVQRADQAMPLEDDKVAVRQAFESTHRAQPV